jgi:hypothetical protein
MGRSAEDKQHVHVEPEAYRVFEEAQRVAEEKQRTAEEKQKAAHGLYKCVFVCEYTL